MKSSLRWLIAASISLAMLVLPARLCVAQSCTTGSPLPIGVIVVDAASTASTPDGLSWPCAFQSLQGALTHASNPGNGVTQIWVAASSTPYVPSAPLDPNSLSDILGVSVYGSDLSARKPVFRLIKNVGIYGGFLGNATGGGETMLAQADPANNITILSGDLRGTLPNPDPDEVDDPTDPTSYDDNAYHVLLYYQDLDDEVPPNPAQFIIDGFTITGGNANGGEDTSPWQGPLNALGGGALIVFEAHHEILGEEMDPGFAEARGPIFSRCVFENNFAELGGGAIAGLYNGGRAIDSTFRNNRQTAAAGTGTQFTSKGVTAGGGAINAFGPVAILKSTFKDNASVEQGGAVFHTGDIAKDAIVVVSNCKFYENTAPNGGAIFCRSIHDLKLLDCTFDTASDDVASAQRETLTSRDRSGVGASMPGVEMFIRSLTVAARCGR